MSELNNESLKENKNTYYFIIEEINKDWEKLQEENEIINKLFLLKSIMQEKNITINQELIEELIQNSIIKEYIKIIIKNHQKEIQNNMINQVIEDDFILELINSYSELVVKEIIKDFDVEEIISHYKISNNLKIYLQEISKIPLLTKEEEIELGKRIQQHDREARQKLIESNLKLVVTIAKRYCYSNLSLEDLIQDGNIGLMRAIEKYDITKNTRFSTHAVWWIRQEITRGIENKKNNIRIPSYRYNQISNYKKALSNLTVEKGREPTDDELAIALNLPIKKIIEIKNIQTDNISTNTLVGEDELVELGNYLVSNEDIEEEVIKHLLKQDVFKVIKESNLTQKEKTILIYRFGLFGYPKKSLKELGQKYHLTKERIRQIELLAIKKLLKTRKGKDLIYYYQEDSNKKETIADETIIDFLNQCHLNKVQIQIMILFSGILSYHHTIKEIGKELQLDKKIIENERRKAILKIKRHNNKEIAQLFMVKKRAKDETSKQKVK